MPDIQQRIADIIERHLVCECGDWAENMSENVAHAAGVLVSELELTQEWALTVGCVRQKVMSERAVKDKAARWPESFGVASRYVTAWEDQ